MYVGRCARYQKNCMGLLGNAGGRLAGTGAQIAPSVGRSVAVQEIRRSQSTLSEAPGTVLAGAAAMAEADGINSQRVLIAGGAVVVLYSVLVAMIFHSELPRHSQSSAESQVALVGAALLTAGSVVRVSTMALRRGVARVPFAAGALAVHAISTTTSWVVYVVPNPVAYDMVTGIRVDMIRLAEWTCCIFVRSLDGAGARGGSVAYAAFLAPTQIMVYMLELLYGSSHMKAFALAASQSVSVACAFVLPFVSLVPWVLVMVVSVAAWSTIFFSVREKLAAPPVSNPVLRHRQLVSSRLVSDRRPRGDGGRG